MRQMKGYSAAIGILLLAAASIGGTASADTMKVFAGLGAGATVPPSTGAPRLAVNTMHPYGLAAGAKGELLVTGDSAELPFEISNHLLRIDPYGTVDWMSPSMPDSPRGIALDFDGSVVWTDLGNGQFLRVRYTAPNSAAVTAIPAPPGPGFEVYDSAIDPTSGNLSYGYKDGANAYIQLGNGVRAGGGLGCADGAYNVALLRNFRQQAYDTLGNFYFTDTDCFAVRKVSPTGTVTTVAGVLNSQGYGNGPATTSRLMFPNGVAFDPWGNMFIGDAGSCTVRKVDKSGTMTLAAGVPSACQLEDMKYLAVDRDGQLFIAEWAPGRVVRVAFTPVNDSVAPATGTRGVTRVTVKGRYFGSAKQASWSVKVGAVSATNYIQWTNEEITFVIPANAPTGNQSVTVVGEGGNSVAKVLRVN
jgi:hypothetical protein